MKFNFSIGNFSKVLQHCLEHSVLFYCLDKALDHYSSYNKVLLIKQCQRIWKLFWYIHNQQDFESLFQVVTCLKNPTNSGCIIFFWEMVNLLFSIYFKHATWFSVRSPQINHQCCKTTTLSNKPNEIFHKCYKYFHNLCFHEDLTNASEVSDTWHDSSFEDVFLE